MIMLTIEVRCLNCETVIWTSRTQLGTYAGLPGTISHEGCRVSQ